MTRYCLDNNGQPDCPTTDQCHRTGCLATPHRFLPVDLRFSASQEVLEKPKILFLDLDGTVRFGPPETGGFVNSASDVNIYPEVPDLLSKYHSDHTIIGISNQAGIAYGFLSLFEAKKAMIATHELSGRRFNRILYCPHRTDANCFCRKPRPGMIFYAIYNSFGFTPSIPPSNCLFIGDRPEDREAAERAGIPFLLAEDWRAGK